MELLSRSISNKKERPVRVVQFGEGNFLRGFVDEMIDIANEKGCFDGDIVIVKPRPGSLATLQEQECQYTVLLRGIENGQEVFERRIVTSVADAVSVYEDYEAYLALARLDTLRFVVSNTTEAGIVYDPGDRPHMRPPVSYPGKLALFLYERYLYFQGDIQKGLIILPTELIADNGGQLKACVKEHAISWKLGTGFLNWLEEACIFCSTLVDRIVSGYPQEEADRLWEEWGYRDRAIVAGEPFALWVIESDRDISREFLPDRAGLPVIFTKDLDPWRQRKVRILNGAHTSFALLSYLAGNDFVGQSVQDGTVGGFIRKTIYEELMPTLPFPKKELEDFGAAVLDRFANPWVKHALLSISLNSVSKWRARCLPGVLDYVACMGHLPVCLTFSFAALLAFYTGSIVRDGALWGDRRGEAYPIRDEAWVLAFFAENSKRPAEEYVRAVLENEALFGPELLGVDGFFKRAAADLEEIRRSGMRRALEKVCRRADTSAHLQGRM